MLPEDGSFLRRIAAIGKANGCIQFGLFSAILHGAVDLRSHLAAHDSAHEAHQPCPITHRAHPNGLHSDNEGVILLYIQVLGTQLYPKVEASTPREYAVESLHADALASLNALDEREPILADACRSRLF